METAWNIAGKLENTEKELEQSHGLFKEHSLFLHIK